MFRFSDDFQGATFLLDPPLGWSGMAPVLVNHTGSLGEVAEPDLAKTSIEVPYGLMLEPDRADWIESATPVFVQAGRSYGGP